MLPIVTILARTPNSRGDTFHVSSADTGYALQLRHDCPAQDSDGPAGQQDAVTEDLNADDAAAP
jgi:hypothetical protein